MKCCFSASIIVLLALVICPWGCTKEGQAARSGPPTAPVTVATVQQRDVPVQIRSIATVEAFSTVTIKSRVAGELQKVHVTPGQYVKAGDLLFEIDPRPFEAALHEALANLQRDTALASNAQIDADRMVGLLKDNVATREEADKARYTAEAAQATVRADQAAVEKARLQLEYAKIRSPIDGRAGALLVHQGNVIKADETELLVINQIQPIYVTFAVPEQDLQAVRRYTQSSAPTVDVIVPPDELPSQIGQLSFIDNQVDTATGTIRLKATFANADRRLWPGQFVQAILNLTVETDATVVPSRSIQMGQQGPFVFVVNDDMTVQMQSVTVRRTVGDDSVLDNGPQPGQIVVTDGQLRLVPGAKVQIQSMPAATPATRTVQP